MTAKELINAVIPALDVADDIRKATSLMENLEVHQLPVVESGQFKGFVSEDVLFAGMAEDTSMGAYSLDAADCRVYIDQHFLEVAKVASDCAMHMVAVIDRDEIFAGVITVDNLFHEIAQTLGVQLAGSVLVISMRQIDYSLAEITRLVEAENAKIIGCYLSPDKADANKIEVTLKLDKKNISHITATLERFNYNIIAIFQEENIVSYEKERLDALMRYLNI